MNHVRKLNLLQVALASVPALPVQQRTILGVSYDHSIRESGQQARSVIDGIEADIVTLTPASDLDKIAAKARLLSPNWQSRLPNNSSPYTAERTILEERCCGIPRIFVEELTKGEIK